MTISSWDLYQRKLTKNGSSQKDRLITNTQRIITDNFSNSPSYHTVTINDISQDVQIVDENSLFKNPNKKRLLCKPDETIAIGDLVVWDSENWLCTDIDDIEIYVRGIIEKCNNNLKYLDSTGEITTIPCIVTDRILLDNKENKYYILPNNEIWVIAAKSALTTDCESVFWNEVWGRDDADGDDENTSYDLELCASVFVNSLLMGNEEDQYSSYDILLTTVDQRFLLSGNAYKVEAIDNITQPGIVTLKMRFDAIIDGDDNVPMGVANYVSRSHTYAITILNGADADIVLSNSLQLQLECTDNSEIVINPSVTYSLVTGSTGIISVSSSGVILGEALGSGSVVTTYNSATDSISIDIVTSVTGVYIYSLVSDVEPSNEVKYQQTKNFTANKYYATGTLFTGSQFEFTVTLSTGASSSNYLLTTSSDTIATLKCLQYPYSITLVATDQDIPANSVAKTISLKGLI